jgi:hypothetical protein
MTILRWTLLLWLGVFAPVASGMAALGHRCDAARHTGSAANALAVLRHADHATRDSGGVHPSSQVQAHHHGHATAHAAQGAGGLGDHPVANGHADRTDGDCCGDDRPCTMPQCAIPTNPGLGAPSSLQPPAAALAQSYPARQPDRLHPGHHPTPLRPPA